MLEMTSVAGWGSVEEWNVFVRILVCFLDVKPSVILTEDAGRYQSVRMEDVSVSSRAIIQCVSQASQSAPGKVTVMVKKMQAALEANVNVSLLDHIQTAKNSVEGEGTNVLGKPSVEIRNATVLLVVNSQIVKMNALHHGTVLAKDFVG